MRAKFGRALLRISAGACTSATAPSSVGVATLTAFDVSSGPYTDPLPAPSLKSLERRIEVAGRLFKPDTCYSVTREFDIDHHDLTLRVASVDMAPPNQGCTLVAATFVYTAVIAAAPGSYTISVVHSGPGTVPVEVLKQNVVLF